MVEKLYMIWTVLAVPGTRLYDINTNVLEKELLRLICGILTRFPHDRGNFPDVSALVAEETFYWFGGVTDDIRLGMRTSMYWGVRAKMLVNCYPLRKQFRTETSMNWDD